MTTWAYTFLPIQQVLLNGGEMEFGALAKKLMGLDPGRFRDESIVDKAIQSYVNCLENIDGIVVFERSAKKYASVTEMERSVQYALHNSVPDMEKWQIYPMKIRSNSKRCYLGILWEEIPRDPNRGNYKRDLPFDDNCDFREEGEDSCKTRCRVGRDILRKYGLILS